MPWRKSDQATSLPGIGTLIQVFHGDAEGIPSRIEDVISGKPTELLIAAPVYAGDVDEPPPGAQFALTWPTSREMLELPVTKLNSERTGLVRLWRMAVAGPSVRVQRRNFGRVPTNLRVDITPLEHASEDRSETRHGITADLSEGGICCTLAPPDVDPGTHVLVELLVDGAHLDIPGVVLRSSTTVDAAGSKCLETAIRFDDPDEYGDVVRRVVFAEQLRARRQGVM